MISQESTVSLHFDDGFSGLAKTIHVLSDLKVSGDISDIEELAISKIFGRCPGGGAVRVAILPHPELLRRLASLIETL